MAIHIPGKKNHYIILYALGTSPECHKTKLLLDELGVEYYYEDVELLSGDARSRVLAEVQRWNPGCSFPTVVLNDTRSIVGYQEIELRNRLKA